MDFHKNVPMDQNLRYLPFLGKQSTGLLWKKLIDREKNDHLKANRAQYKISQPKGCDREQMNDTKKLSLKQQSADSEKNDHDS